MKICVCVVALVALGCSPSPTAKGMVSEEALAIAVQKSAELETRFEADRKRLEGTIGQLKVENADLRARLGMAESVASMNANNALVYQEGLNKAVNELNRVGQAHADTTRQLAADAAYVAASPAPRARANAASDVFFASPQLSIVDRSLFASGSAHNSGGEDAVGTLVLSLMRDGVEIDTATMNFRASAGTWTDWSHQFTIPSSNGQYAVRARMNS